MRSLFLLCVMIVSAGTSVLAQNPMRFYGGLNSAPVLVKEFGKFDISDWQQYGLRSVDPTSDEGRLRVDLTDKTPKSPNGLFIGLSREMSPTVDLLFEAQIAVSGFSLTTGMLGLNIELLGNETFAVGITPKLGYSRGKVELGTIELLSGYTDPVILDEGTFYNGDPLSLEFSGLVANIGMTASIALSKSISIIGNGGYNLSFVSTDGIVSGSNVIPMSSAAVVQTDGTSSKAQLEPSINPTGLSFQVGLSFSI